MPSDERTRPPAARRLPSAAGLAGLVLLALPAAAAACPVCFGDPASPLTKGMKAGVLFLLAITGLVLGGFASAFLFFWLRSRKLHRLEMDLTVHRLMEASKR